MTRGGEELVRTVRSLQPHVLINNRLDLPGRADIVTPEQYILAAGMRDVAGTRS